MAMDFDPDITGIAAQPFWLHWRGEDGRPRRHAPDFFARRADGSGLVVDVRPDDRIPARDAGAFRVTAMACGQAGWEFRRAGAIDQVVRPASALGDQGLGRGQFQLQLLAQVQRLLADECELCGSRKQVEVHHIRALKDLDRKGKNPPE